MGHAWEVLRFGCIYADLPDDNSFESTSKILKREGEKEHLYNDLSKHRIGKGSYLSIILRLS